MNIAIIGAGFTGMAAAYKLSRAGHSVTLFEKEASPGGLAGGYKEKNWQWTLEQHYHHWFTNDDAILSLAREISYPVIVTRPKTSIYKNGSIYQLDSPLSVLLFPLLSIMDRIRMAGTLAFLRLYPFWKVLEKYKTEDFLVKYMGKKAYEMLWKPQLYNKFSVFASKISLAWFWARIKKRTPSLAYPQGGYLSFAQHLVSVIEKNGGLFKFATTVTNISQKNQKYRIIYESNGKYASEFDRVIVTLPFHIIKEIVPSFSRKYKKSLESFSSLGATNLVLRLSKPLLKDGTYWLSICDENSPVMAIVEHTNFMDKKNYSNEHLIYIGNYMSVKDVRFTMKKEQLLSSYDSLLKKLNSDYRSTMIDYRLFKAPFAQPIISINYSRKIIPIQTPFANLYLANMHHVYPWDRGTNYAVELGFRVADFILSA